MVQESKTTNLHEIMRIMKELQEVDLSYYQGEIREESKEKLKTIVNIHDAEVVFLLVKKKGIGVIGYKGLEAANG